MQRILLIVGAAIVGMLLIVGSFAYVRITDERANLTSDLQYRTYVLADSLNEAVRPPLQTRATSSVQHIIDRIAGNERIAGIAVYDSSAALVARSSAFPSSLASTTLVSTSMDSAQSSGEIVADPSGSLYLFVEPLSDKDGNVVGALVVVQNASYIDIAIGQILRDNFARLFLLILLMSLTVIVLVRWVFYRPLSQLSEHIRAVRAGEASDGELNADGLLSPLAGEISKVTRSLRQARFSASEEARMRLEKLDSPWTAERLKEFIKAYVKDRPIFVLSNREPYLHQKTKGKLSWSMPAGGVVVALDSVMEATGGTWIAHGSGSADQEASDAEGKVRVPPEEPRYTLKRISLTPQEVKGYYDGFSNEALWPLCHMAHVRPLFRAEDWKEYRRVNALFAKTLLEEIKHVERPLVLIQDYHLALTPALIKKSRPDAQVAIFWHIPWPSAAQFSICPWRREILMGLIGADLIGFHTQQNCNNFIETVAAEVESRIDYETFSIFHAGHQAFVKAFPISIAFPAPESAHRESAAALEALGLADARIILGVDRLDYTKGILERLKGFEFLLKQHPEYREKVSFLQIAAPTRESVEKYREYAGQVVAEVERINQAYGTRTWKPIVLERRNYSHDELRPLYRAASVCIVSSLHDGMNLVAKEFVAARDDESGVLVLSSFAGASRELKGALIINPYSAEETSAALHGALSMPKTEQYRRMKTMRDTVRDYNVYRWAAEMIKALARGE